MTRETNFDIILWGGSSFVGKLVAEYLNTQYGANGSLRWAIGGRNERKLAATRRALGPDAEELPLFVGDAFDRQFLGSMVRNTKVVLSTVGPYKLYGGGLVEACAENGTDYCDLSGEITFVREMMDLHSERARASGARILTCCGVDSLPSDLGVYILHQAARRRSDSSIAHVTNEVHAFRGGFSGGTILSLCTMRNEAAQSARIAEILENPYAICPPARRRGVQQSDVDAVQQLETGKWLGPFFMAIVNTRVVHATNAHLEYPYGPDFTYIEGMSVGGRLAANLLGAFSRAFYWAYKSSLLRDFLEAVLLPKPAKGRQKKFVSKGFSNFVCLPALDQVSV
ncbi:MAG: saccharopine dehydrogenase NADP-binding domain-containing protein [Dinoroseobacter sp.]|nr:saccharopine dehydrogenase NADP-binding domain-containing protein [Dinoroseobacter sp.]